jgi:hypothetical protein
VLVSGLVEDVLKVVHEEVKERESFVVPRRSPVGAEAVLAFLRLGQPHLQ